MARYRLRFQLQEVDLPPGETLIGRSLECQVTIEDPLVSRQHARIVVHGDEATLEDLGSRNGVKLNAATIRGAAALNDGDRLRIGTQELVVSRIEAASTAKHSRATGVLRLCANCKLPYPRELLACPNCEATEQTDEETLSGSFNAVRQQSWSVQLLIEALERALSLGRLADGERILQRASTQVEEMLATGSELDSKQLAGVVAGALRISVENEDVAWGRWALRVYRIRAEIPPAPVAELMATLCAKNGEAVLGELRELLTELHRASPGKQEPQPEQRHTLARLDDVLAGGTGAAGNGSSRLDRMGAPS